ncbi:hypothetical protein [Actinoplanes sp. NPDC051411]|uniref:hypothetical protein n=1 Tax=Actinoplanes sp. NPDC051411 TaxID=3155522 RepID=UPI00344264F3
MKNLRGPVITAALTLALAVAGCAKDATDDKAAAKPSDPKAALAASTSGLTAGNYAFSESMPDAELKGTVHVPSKSASVAIDSHAADGAGKLEMLQIEPDRWVRMSFDLDSMLQGVDRNDPAMKPLLEGLKAFDGKTWMHLDLSKAENAQDLNIDLSRADVTGAGQLLSGVVTAHGDAHDITGTLDATKAGDDLDEFDSEDVKAMGAAAKALPFTAKLDDQGRLSHLELTVPQAGETPAGRWTVDVTGYGTQQPLTKPAGNVEEMPASGYEMLSN